ncbi:WD40 repeat domain-containing protein [Streptosporangium pseudovulgare]|uniref:Novel STAND NTPase 1 domain-containing protein n=1 Tax=Streptosporangium pseudovulgare TaxID=35765 RepID=A0ABQ2RB77_9ACTN|nr:WD40 repeat domain-containing protein [Streptosporangium pseudovulgare]GGQ18129.1 hypothetical protein GCM10010140_55660 [Streptosporangium pseudovulgare]
MEHQEAPGGVSLSPEQIAAAQQGAQSWVRRAAGRAVAWTTPRALLATLCASALTPLALADPGAAVLLAGMNVIGSVGGNVLATVISSALDAARARTGGTEEERAAHLEEELAVRLEEALRPGDARADALTKTLAATLEAVDATRAALGEALAGGHAELLERMASGFAELGRQNAALVPMLERLDAAAGEVQEILYRQDAERRHQTALLVTVRDRLSVLERRLTAGASSAPEPQWIGGCPYQGLAPFGPAQAAVFHGRGQATSRLVAMVNGGGLIVVTGASGAGKSSLLHAGLLPALTTPSPQHDLDDAPQITFTPGTNPLRHLALQLALPCGADAGAVLGELREDPAQAAVWARQMLSAEVIRRRQQGGNGEVPRRVVMVVDQFEELFTLSAEGSAERAAFVDALHAITMGGPGVVVVAVRGDFVDRCATHRALARALEERMFVLEPMSEAELLRAITGPAAAAGLEVEKGLAEQVVRELAGHLRAPADVGALPLLSMAMVRTWENRDGDRLTRQGYDRSGGVASAVHDAAEAVYARLSPEQQEISRRVITALVLLSDDGQVTRRRLGVGELTALCAERPEAVREVVTTFTDARLMVTAGTVELAHDVLTTAWGRLRDWLDDDRADRVLHGEIEKAAAKWDAEEREASFLYRGVRLENAGSAVARWRAGPRRGLRLTSVAEEFLRAGAAAAMQSRRRWRRVIVVLCVLVVGLSGVSVSLIRSNQEVGRQRDTVQQRGNEILSRQLAAHSETLSADPVTSARLAVAAWAIAGTGEARASLVSVLSRPERAVLASRAGAVKSVAFSPDGSRLATAEADGAVRLWDTATHEQVGSPMTGHEGAVRSVAFSPDGTRLATAGSDGTTRVWDLIAHERLGAPVKGHDDEVQSVAFSPDGSRLATTGGGKTHVWDLATRERVGAPMVGTWSVAFSPDGARLATAGDDGAVHLWNTRTHARIGAPMKGHDGAVWSVAFSPDGSRIASAGFDGTVRVWDTATREQAGSPMAGHKGAVRSVAFSPDGAHLATVGDDGTARVWDLAAHRQIGAPMSSHRHPSSVAFSPDGARLATSGNDGARLWDVTVHRQAGAPMARLDGSVRKAIFSPDGTRLVTTGGNGTARLWDLATRRPLGGPLAGHVGELFSVTLSPDGTRLATAGGDGTVRVWDMLNHRQLGEPLTGHAGPVESVAFSPDGSRLATTGDDGTARLWDLTTYRQLGKPVSEDQGPLFSAVFSPDGSRLAIAGGDGTIRVWDPATRRQLGDPLTGHKGPVFSVAFDPRGSRLAGAGFDGTVRLWDVATRRQLGAPLTGHEGPVQTVAFSPDGTRLATAGGDGTARVWDVDTHRQIGDSLTAHEGPVHSAAFSSDGSRLVTAGTMVRIWDVELPGDLVGAVCAVAGRSFDQREWRRFIPYEHEPYRQSCPAPR